MLSPSTGATLNAVAPARRGGWLAARLRADSALVPWLYLAPTLLLLALFTYWPLLQTAYLSLVDWNMNPSQPTQFVGTDN